MHGYTTYSFFFHSIRFESDWQLGTTQCEVAFFTHDEYDDNDKEDSLSLENESPKRIKFQ